MQPGWMSSRFYQTCDWIWKLAYINLLWLSGTLLGLVVLGFLPATTAMFTVLRKWFTGNPDVAITRTFFQAYKNEFLKINLLGAVLLLGAYILYFNYMYLGTVEGTVHMVLSLGWYAFLILYIITLFYIIPAYVHYNLKLFQYIKTALIIGFVNPLALVTLAISIGLLGYLLYLVPGLIPFFGPSTFALIVMWCANMSFNRVEKKKEKLELAGQN
ncbi:YesL family protein [Halalkalibacterium halodurans]|uniref:BH2108 protein n=2 Tax=Halalkalibacterium halodurans TaxID=86665 RepID=Q9KB27_HALH5|nr:YesL family protein [Halalkalibacterium halodurans]MDY7222657.1 YesL family protein [Halalkalibacterium halodurans]MDY7241878.1 YesL family protein [Halalkalibacterium halodurans]MED4082480.1 YesL family protein [Halalkalibacterium halodurans]MED4085015.1 YesL family protein [Halalkalibacterium halodurans]MED4107119.1 YesL family protein [Halalkalibacterium halodurans]